MRRFIIINAVISMLLACSSEKKQDTAETGVSGETSANAEPETISKEPLIDDDDPLFQLGMPSFCSLETQSGKSCFSCTPRELPLKRCSEMPATFDAAKHCHHDLDQMQCETIDFAWDFNDRDNTEAMYERLPIVALLVKTLLASKLKDDPETATHIGTIIDLIVEYRLSIFTGQNLDKVASEGVDLIQKIRPGTEIDVGQATATLTSILGVLAKKSEQGHLNESDVLQMLAGMFGQLPAELGDIASLLAPGALAEEGLASDTEEEVSP